jgi:hypothetical protein
VTQARPEKALIVLHNNGAFSAFGVQSRYGFVFARWASTGQHGCRGGLAWPAHFQRIHPAGQSRHHLCGGPHCGVMNAVPS